MAPRSEIGGQRFGRLTAIATDGHDTKGILFWRCRCDCGRDTRVRSTPLKAGKIVSCGCYRAEIIKRGTMRTHGMTGTTEFRIWGGMLGRAHFGTSGGTTRYLRRGITVCERWLTFENFFADMGRRPPGMSLDRIDNDGPYSPENCRWATATEQARNRGDRHMITANGRTQNMVAWAEDLGVNKTVIYCRLKRGWTPEEAVSTPIGATNRKHLAGRLP